jgi:hypothetical protein
MVTWFLHLMQGDFSRNPTAWLDLIISMFSLAAAPIVKIFDSKKAKIDARNAQHNFDTQLNVLKRQLEEAHKLNDSLHAQIEIAERNAKASEIQASVAARADSIPRWDIRRINDRKIQYVIENQNSFTAFDVQIRLDNGTEYNFEDMAAGSSSKFDFIEMGIWDLQQDSIMIEWSDKPNGKRHTLKKALLS